MRRTFSIFSGTIVGQAQQVECKVRATKVMLAGDPSVPAEFTDYRIMVNWTYAPRKFRPTSGPAARRIRAERHNPHSIATLRIRLARFLLKQLRCCPFCCIRRL
jgi:hypothetical protein